MSEGERYAAIQAQIAMLLDQAANDADSNGMIGLGAVWLAANLYERNEHTHARKQEQRRDE